MIVLRSAFLRARFLSSGTERNKILGDQFEDRVKQGLLFAGLSASNPGVVSTLSADLNTQGTRPGTTYAAWAGGNPLLTDPDGDGDGDDISNSMEYGAGTDALDSSSRPAGSLAFEDLTGLGLGNHEPVFSFAVATNRNDLTLLPSTSTNLLNWSFEPLEFLDATDLGGSHVELRFRSKDASAARRFFRFGSNP